MYHVKEETIETRIVIGRSDDLFTKLFVGNYGGQNSDLNIFEGTTVIMWTIQCNTRKQF